MPRSLLALDPLKRFLCSGSRRCVISCFPFWVLVTNDTSTSSSFFTGGKTVEAAGPSLRKAITPYVKLVCAIQLYPSSQQSKVVYFFCGSLIQMLLIRKVSGRESDTSNEIQQSRYNYIRLQHHKVSSTRIMILRSTSYWCSYFHGAMFVPINTRSFL